jgi:hypothetical protein
MKTGLFTIAIALTLMTLPSVAAASTILSAGSADWEYTFVDPTADLTWNTTTGGWATGAAPFGTETTGDFAYATLWPADATATLNDDLWVRRTVDFTGYDLNTIQWNLGVDNGYKLYLNGVLVSDDNAEGYTVKWEYTGMFPGALPGMNILALALEDHGGLTAFDMEINGQAVPDTGNTMPLLLAGLGVLGIGYSRFRL